MSTTPMPPRPPAEPEDPELRERYRRDADTDRERRRTTSAARAAEVVPSRTPSGPIKVVALLVTTVLVLITGVAMIGPMLQQDETTAQSLPSDISTLDVRSDVGGVRVRTAEPGEEPQVTRTVEFGLVRPDTSIDSSGGTATLRSHCPQLLVGTVCSTEWVVVVPEGTDVRLHQGVGDVTVEGATGDVDAEVGVGDLDVTESTSPSVSVDMGVGDVLVEAVEPPRRVDASLGVGDLTIRVPGEVDYSVRASGQTVTNRLGDDVDAPRRIMAEVGVGALTILPE